MRQNPEIIFDGQSSTEQHMPYAATVVDLGQGNEGQFGPTAETEDRYDAFVEEVENPEYRRKPTGNWICVDGREAVEGAIDDGEHADGQMPGSLPITNTAGDLMDDAVDAPLSVLVAKNTKQAVADGHEVTVHGDDHNGKDGCAANAKMRATLAKIAANGDIIAPRVWTFCEATRLSQWVTPEDVMAAIVAAGERAKDDSVWDATPAEVVDIAVANGAKYQVLKGSHQEQAVVAPLEGTYATQTFAKDHPTEDGGRNELFGMSAGEYVKTTLADETGRGATERDAALKAMRGLVYGTGLCKKIGNQWLRVIALQTA